MIRPGHRQRLASPSHRFRAAARPVLCRTTHSTHGNHTGDGLLLARLNPGNRPGRCAVIMV
jgi:hypothetical protein